MLKDIDTLLKIETMTLYDAATLMTRLRDVLDLADDIIRQNFQIFVDKYRSNFPSREIDRDFVYLLDEQLEGAFSDFVRKQEEMLYNLAHLSPAEVKLCKSFVNIRESLEGILLEKVNKLVSEK